MVYNSQKFLDIQALEFYKGREVDEVINIVERQMVIDLAMKLWEDGYFKFNKFDPRVPLDIEGLNERQIEIMKEKRKELMYKNQIELTLKFAI
jgi:hypothetical protein